MVTIIVRTYNSEKYIKKCIDSIIAQSYKNWILYVVDNNSNDSTLNIIKDYNNSNIIILSINNNGILAKSINLGIKNTSTDIIAFLDSDDLWLEDKLKLCTEKIRKGADLVYHDCSIIDQNGTSIQKVLKTRDLSKKTFDDLLLNGNCIIFSSVVCKASIFTKVGLFCEDINCNAAEDFEMWLRIARSNFIMRKLDGIHGNYRVHSSNESSMRKTVKYTEYIHALYFNYIKNSFSGTPFWILIGISKKYFLEKQLFHLFILTLKIILFYPIRFTKHIFIRI